MKLSASKAAKETGVSIPTITRALKSGKLSGERVEGGGWLIDAAELFRVFPAVTPVSDETPDTLGHETRNVTGVLEVEIKMLREMLESMKRREADLMEDRDHWREQAERATKLIAAPVVVPAAPMPQQGQGRGGWSSLLKGLVAKALKPSPAQSPEERKIG